MSRDLTRQLILMISVLVHFAVTANCRGQDITGGIRGMISDAEFGGPVPGAAITLSEKGTRLKTGKDGYFLFEKVEPGSYTLIMAKSGYERRIVRNVVVSPGSLAEVNVDLKGEFTEMEEMVVKDLKLDDTSTEIGLLAMRETSLSFQDSISRDLMSKAGAGDAASALKLVTGASVADGKYATVRGLSDRYVGTSVNGIRVPSSDPKKRAVQIDVFPSGTIEGMSVYKTFTPDLPGDWSGGGIDINTLSIPDGPFLKLSVSRGIHSEDTGREDFITYEGGGCGAWGRHGGARDMPDYSGYPSQVMSARFEQLADEDHPHSPDWERVDEITGSFDSAMGTTRKRMPPSFGISISAGQVIDLGAGWTFGDTAAFTYKKGYSMTDKTDNSLNYDIQSKPYELIDRYYERETGEEEVKWSMLFSMGLDKDEKHKFNMTYLRTRTASDEASLRVETNDPTALYYTESQSIQYSERSVDSLQFKAEHNWPDLLRDGLGLKVDWFGAYNIAEQEEPDMRNLENYVIESSSGGNTTWLRGRGVPGPTSGADPIQALRMWRNTKEVNTQLGLNLTIPFSQNVPDLSRSFLGMGRDAGENVWGKEEGRFKVGALWDWTKRVYDQQTFGYFFADPEGGGYPPSNPESLPGYPQQGPQSWPGDPADPGYGQWIDLNPPFGWWVWQHDQAAYDAAVDAWELTPAGQRYTAARDAKKKHQNLETFTTDDPAALWTDEFTGSEYLGLGDYVDQMRWYIKPSPMREVDYTGFQDLQAGYWMLDYPLTKQLKVMCGARLEVTDMSIEPKSSMGNSPLAFLVPEFKYAVSTNDAGDVERFPAQVSMGSTDTEGARTNIQDAVWLRSVGFVYKLKPQMNLRYNWSQTIARPTFRELAPVVQYDFIEGEAFLGNSELELVRLRNTDIRWEWFPTPGEVFAVSWFKKLIEGPIELWDFGYLGRTYTTVLNYPEGEVSGWEVEGRKIIEEPAGLPGKLTLGANYTLIDAKVRMTYGLAEKLEYYDVL